MFNAPELIANIPDISALYDINETQGEELDAAVDRCNDNIFFEDMHEEQCARWEAMLSIMPLDDDTLDERRFRIQTKALERLPYSYRVFIRKLDTLLEGNYSIAMNETLTYCLIKIGLSSKRMISDVQTMADSMLPLNMYFVCQIMWNTYGMLQGYTHGDLSAYQHITLREEVMEV